MQVHFWHGGSWLYRGPISKYVRGSHFRTLKSDPPTYQWNFKGCLIRDTTGLQKINGNIEVEHWDTENTHILIMILRPLTCSSSNITLYHNTESMEKWTATLLQKRQTSLIKNYIITKYWNIIHRRGGKTVLEHTNCTPLRVFKHFIDQRSVDGDTTIRLFYSIKTTVSKYWDGTRRRRWTVETPNLMINLWNKLGSKHQPKLTQKTQQQQQMHLIQTSTMKIRDVSKSPRGKTWEQRLDTGVGFSSLGLWVWSQEWA